MLKMMSGFVFLPKFFDFIFSSTFEIYSVENIILEENSYEKEVRV
jgi:hypothetical protein